LPTFRECFEELARRAVQESASYEQYLLELVERECQVRLAKRTKRLLDDSRLPLEKDLASFDMGRLPAKVSRQVRTLIEGSFVDRRENLLLFGKTGTGKTHLLSAIAQELIRSGRKVVSWSCALLVQELLVAKRDLKLSRVLKRMHVVAFIAGNQRSFMLFVAGLPAASLLGFSFRRLRPSVRMSRTGRQRRILRRLALRLPFQRLDPRLQFHVVCQKRANDRLGFRRLTSNDLFSDSRRHATVVAKRRPPCPDQFMENRVPGRERLH
jgi:DNA helicase HerA-like ATPase